MEMATIVSFMKTRREHYITHYGKFYVKAAAIQEVLTEMNRLDPLVVTAADLTCVGLEIK